MQIPHADSPISSSITISAGVATLVPTTEDCPSRLTSLADNALYEAKGRGRDQTVASDTC
ncbi:diguanylate cyclase domain-containing protein [Porticoccus sp.]|uniref:diguanylate cyclase domain-containing protein n=1 Tax=Porticoccus sp. TaxID=2024853 RepID=UPI003F695810